jgi:hypothetical protein
MDPTIVGALIGGGFAVASGVHAHGRLMASLKPFMGPAKFVTWTISTADGRPSLAGVLERLASG